MGTFTPSTPLSKWVGYQILAGAGRGMVLQMVPPPAQDPTPPHPHPLSRCIANPPQPVIAVQSVLPTSQTATGSALVLFCQIFGGAIAVAVAQLTLTNSLAPALRQYTPRIDPADIINAGATSVRGVIPAAELGGVLLAYNSALTRVFVGLLPILCGAARWLMGSLACGCRLCSAGGWE